jgi:hypothetical protein
MAAVGDSCGAGSATASSTRVQVYEGVVTVRTGSNETGVAAGETWPSGCVAPAPLPGAPPASAPRASSSRAIERSQLAEQNDLYAKAVTLRERGDTASSLVLFERLVARYPSSPLAENAAAERMKLLASTHRPDAGQAADDYLARYPSGFARRDAEAIVARERPLH